MFQCGSERFYNLQWRETTQALNVYEQKDKKTLIYFKNLRRGRINMKKTF